MPTVVEGVVTLRAVDVGQLVGPTPGEVRGIAAIVDATDGLSGMTGVLAIEGSVDLVSGLSTYSYEGRLNLGD